MGQGPCSYKVCKKKGIVVGDTTTSSFSTKDGSRTIDCINLAVNDMIHVTPYLFIRLF